MWACRHDSNDSATMCGDEDATDGGSAQGSPHEAMSNDKFRPGVPIADVYGRLGAPVMIIDTVQNHEAETKESGMKDGASMISNIARIRQEKLCNLYIRIVLESEMCPPYYL